MLAVQKLPGIGPDKTSVNKFRKFVQQKSMLSEKFIQKSDTLPFGVKLEGNGDTPPCTVCRQRRLPLYPEQVLALAKSRRWQIHADTLLPGARMGVREQGNV